MEKLRVIDRWHPGFLRCILDLAAESVVGISSGGGNLVQRALKLMKARKMKIQKPARVLNLKIILSDNGLDQDKRDKFEKTRALPTYIRTIVRRYLIIAYQGKCAVEPGFN